MIHLECDNDESLMLALGMTRAEVSHHAGKGRVSRALSQSSRRGDIGLVDQDPGQPPPPYLREFEAVEIAANLGLALYRHPKDGKKLIEIRPDLEPWLYQLGRDTGVNPADHHLPATHRLLHQEAKKQRRHLINYLRSCCDAKSRALEKLKAWLSEGEDDAAIRQR